MLSRIVILACALALFATGAHAEQWQRKAPPAYFNARQILGATPKEQREAFAQEKCVASTAARDREAALGWCMLGFDINPHNPVLLENASLLVVLFGGDGTGSERLIDNLYDAADAASKPSDAARYSTLATLLRVRINYAGKTRVRFDTKLYGTLAESLGLPPLKQKTIAARRLELTRAMTALPPSRESAWALASVAATWTIRTPSEGLETINATLPTFLQYLRQIKTDPASLSGFETALPSIAFFHEGVIFSAVEDYAGAAAFLADAANKGAAFSWAESEPCTETRFRAAQYGTLQDLIAADANYLAEKKPRLQSSSAFEDWVHDPPCKLIFLVDLAADGSVETSKNIFTEPAGRCESVGAQYLARIRYPPIGPDGSPGERRKSIIVGFPERWP